MRDDHDGHAERLVDLLEQRENGLRGRGVQRAGGLVAQQIFWLRGEGACNGHTLFLSAGELRRISVRTVGQTDQFEQLLGAFSSRILFQARDLQREADVFQDGALLQQVEPLKDHADRLPCAQQLLAGQDGQILPVEQHLAGGRALEQVDTPHQRALACTGKADDAENLAVLNRQVDVAQRRERAGRGIVGFV